MNTRIDHSLSVMRGGQEMIGPFEKHIKNSRGFTLIEVLVVASITPPRKTTMPADATVMYSRLAAFSLSRTPTRQDLFIEDPVAATGRLSPRSNFA